ncbi:hypothetical protein BRC94_02820 [Halobacteriales archaeon QS_5_70_17]|nr:MAG: hypothetical protein BRC94_02820 [Halobacteriales archaeon QS_5_70_17]
MDRVDPYRSSESYYECQSCGSRVRSGEYVGACPDCDGRVRDIAVSRE